MFRKNSVIFTLLLFLGLSSFTLSAQENVVLVYKANNQTTKHVFEHLRRGARQLGLNYKITALSADKNLSGTTAGVIVLNISSSGLDPAIQSFLDRNQTLTHPIILTLKPGSREYIFSYEDATKTPIGIDTLTAATGWSERNKANQIMHQAWINKIFELITKK